MAEFSVILEDVYASPGGNGGKILYLARNKRIDVIEAEDINSAWDMARDQYYVKQTAGPETQIVDIKPGTIELEEPQAVEPELEEPQAVEPEVEEPDAVAEEVED